MNENQNIQTKKIAENCLIKILSYLDKETMDKYYNNPNLEFNKIATCTDINNNIINKKISFLKNILTYYTLFDNERIYNIILARCIFYSMDPISKVRSTSCKIIAELIIYLYKRHYNKDKLLKLFEVYAMNKKYQQRINFIKICKHIILLDNLIYYDKLKELLFILTEKEKNYNVIISLAKAIKKVIITKNSVCGREPSLHYLCKKINDDSILTIKKTLIDVPLQNNIETDKFKNVKIPKGQVFTQDTSYFKEEFGIETKKKNLEQNNIINKDEDNENKFIN
jgi:hypothetical protein